MLLTETEAKALPTKYSLSSQPRTLRGRQQRQAFAPAFCGQQFPDERPACQPRCERDGVDRRQTRESSTNDLDDASLKRWSSRPRRSPGSLRSTANTCRRFEADLQAGQRFCRSDRELSLSQRASSIGAIIDECEEQADRRRVSRGQGSGGRVGDEERQFRI